jgi:hypothetical protein
LSRIASATGTGSRYPSQTTASRSAGLSASIASTRCRLPSAPGTGRDSVLASAGFANAKAANPANGSPRVRPSLASLAGLSFADFSVSRFRISAARVTMRPLR